MGKLEGVVDGREDLFLGRRDCVMASQMIHAMTRPMLAMRRMSHIFNFQCMSARTKLTARLIPAEPQ